MNNDLRELSTKELESINGGGDRSWFRTAVNDGVAAIKAFRRGYKDEGSNSRRKLKKIKKNVNHFRSC